MNVNRRTQADRTAATRTALIDAGRRLFGERGYSAVGTEEIARVAGVTRGALYHQFEDKQALFSAVFEALEETVLMEIAAQAASAADGPVNALRRSVGAWLDACERPEVQRIILLDAPGVLGWETWREIAERYALGATIMLLQTAIDAGSIAPQPVRPVAHILIGALDEAALYVARADDRDTARREVDVVIDRVLAGITAPASD
jgi:AcrR family transcriptional regulator